MSEIIGSTAFKSVVSALQNHMKGGNLPYHNDHHVDRVTREVITIFDRLKYQYPENQDLDDIGKVSLVIAALGHDIIYIPGSTYNEAVSADFVDNMLSNFSEFDKANNSIRDKVKSLILETTISRHLSDKEVPILYKILLDADLIALSDLYATFEQTQFAIMREAIDNSASIKKTKDFLTLFLNKKEIYRVTTDREEKARANIKQFIGKSDDVLQKAYDNYVLRSVL